MKLNPDGSIEGTVEEITKYQQSKEECWQVFSTMDNGDLRTYEWSVSYDKAKYLCQENRNMRAYKRGEFAMRH